MFEILDKTNNSANLFNKFRHFNVAKKLLNFIPIRAQANFRNSFRETESGKIQLAFFHRQPKSRSGYAFKKYITIFQKFVSVRRTTSQVIKLE